MTKIAGSTEAAVHGGGQGSLPMQLPCPKVSMRDNMLGRWLNCRRAQAAFTVFFVMSVMCGVIGMMGVILWGLSSYIELAVGL
mmetsp:Transcript_37598/g.83724  ORF Transcript_37598/g.83724 Transcript_37598/m.83724 type:complete len:83 (-) Transcript_37598:471-719(-)